MTSSSEKNSSYQRANIRHCAKSLMNALDGLRRFPGPFLRNGLLLGLFRDRKTYFRREWWRLGSRGCGRNVVLLHRGVSAECVLDRWLPYRSRGFCFLGQLADAHLILRCSSPSPDGLKASHRFARLVICRAKKQETQFWKINQSRDRSTERVSKNIL